MPLPFNLPVGLVSIYGVGTITGQTGIIAPEGFEFGVVDQVYSGSVVDVYGKSVMFRQSDKVCTVTYNDWPYVLVEQARLVSTEIIVL